MTIVKNDLFNYAKARKQAKTGQGIAQSGATFSSAPISPWPVLTFPNAAGISTGGKAAVVINTMDGNTIKIDDCFIQYLDMISLLLGVGINYTDFSNLSNESRMGYVNQIIRDIKLKQLDI